MDAALLNLRKYRREDLEVLAAIDSECFEQGVAYSLAELGFFVEHPESIARVAVLDGVIAGFVVGRLGCDGVAHVITLDVVEPARRKGIGRKLMEALHRLFRLRSARRVALEVAESNGAARSFYTRLGYREAGRLTDYYGPGKHALLMTLTFGGEGSSA